MTSRGAHGRIRLMLVGGIMVLILSIRAAGQPVSPTTAPAVNEQNQTDLFHRSTEKTAAATERPSSPQGFDVSKVVMALAIVLSAIFFLRWCGKRIFPNAAAGRSTRAIQVLSRSIISPKQQFMLVQVGRRLIVVADSGTQMSTLCEINDADEVAALVGQINEEKSNSITSSFGNLMRRAKEDYEPKPRQNPPAEISDGAVSEGMDPSLNVTRRELSGLMDKVRLMSRQFR